MSGLGEIIKALKDAILLTERVEKLGEDTGSLAHALREEAQNNRHEIADLRDRVARLEARIDILLDIIKVRAAVAPLGPAQEVKSTLANPGENAGNVLPPDDS